MPTHGGRALPLPASVIATRSQRLEEPVRCFVEHPVVYGLTLAGSALIAICAFIGFKVPLHWGLIPAVIGGFSVAVLWWSISRAFAGQE